MSAVFTNTTDETQTFHVPAGYTVVCYGPDEDRPAPPAPDTPVVLVPKVHVEDCDLCDWCGCPIYEDIDGLRHFYDEDDRECNAHAIVPMT